MFITAFITCVVPTIILCLKRFVNVVLAVYVSLFGLDVTLLT